MSPLASDEPTRASARSRYERRVRDLTAFGHRGSGTARERAAADYLCAELRGLGLRPDLEPFRGATSMAPRLLLPVCLAAVGVLLMPGQPIATVILGLAALLSLWREQSCLGEAASRLLPGAPSQNIVARVPAATNARRRLVVCAHYDTQRTAWMWRFVTPARLNPLLRHMPRGLQSPLFSIALALLLQIAVGIVAMAVGLNPVLLAAAGLALLAYVCAGALFLEWSRGSYVPGASDNASGVAAALSLAEAWLSQPAGDVELQLLLTGCEEAGLLGAMAWRAAAPGARDAIPTLFLNLDGLGFGPPRILGEETPLVGFPAPYPPDLVRRACEIAGRLQLTNAGPHVVFGPTDGLALLRGGMRGLTLVGFRDGGALPHYHLPSDTADEVDYDAAWRGVSMAGELLRWMASEE